MSFLSYTNVISVRLDEDTQAALQDAAARSGVGLSTYLRRIAEAEARRVRRERIREQSQAVGRYVAGNTEARALYEDWGAPTTTPEQP
jgi:uncharacterized protein (DUF1778 family)